MVTTKWRERPRDHQMEFPDTGVGHLHFYPNLTFHRPWHGADMYAVLRHLPLEEGGRLFGQLWVKMCNFHRGWISSWASNSSARVAGALADHTPISEILPDQWYPARNRKTERKLQKEKRGNGPREWRSVTSHSDNPQCERLEVIIFLWSTCACRMTGSVWPTGHLSKTDAPGGGWRATPSAGIVCSPDREWPHTWAFWPDHKGEVRDYCIQSWLNPFPLHACCYGLSCVCVCVSQSVVSGV